MAVCSTASARRLSELAAECAGGVSVAEAGSPCEIAAGTLWFVIREFQLSTADDSKRKSTSRRQASPRGGNALSLAAITLAVSFCRSGM